MIRKPDRSRRLVVEIILIGTLFFLNCSPQQKNSRATVSARIQETTSYDIPGKKQAGVFDLPPSVVTGDGISEAEAVSLALYNNQQFQADLITISLSEADLIDAGVVSNPLLRYLAPSGGISVSGYINFGLDFLFQRPKRIAAASAELNRVKETMVQKGYTLIRDVQIAYTDLLLAKERASIYAENLSVRTQMAQLANSRLRHGDISELETLTFRADSATAVDDLVKATLDTLVKKNTLNALLGFSPDTTIVLQLTTFNIDSIKNVPADYLNLAYTYQPDIKAAEISIDAIGKRLGWERSRIILFTATLNFQHLPGEGGSKWLPNAANPGFQMELPLFNRNQGRIAKARAELEQAAFQYIATKQRIALDAANALDRYDQNRQSYQSWASGVLPSLEEAVRLSRSSYARGDIAYLPVLEAMRQLLNAKLRKAEIEAEIKKATSTLNFFIGNKWNN